MIKIICPKCHFTRDVPGENIPSNVRNIKCPLCNEIFPVPLDVRDKAGFFIRMLAIIIDILIINALFLLISFSLDYLLTKTLPLYGITDEELITNIVGGVIYFSYLVFFPTYFIFFTYKYGKTPGKKIMGIEIISTCGDKITLAQTIKREFLGKILSGMLLGAGFFMVIFSKNKQGLHDKIAKTLVVYKN